GARIVPVPVPCLEIGRVVGAILTPVIREFRIDTDGFRSFRVDTPSASIGGHVAVVASNLYQFLVAMKNRLQVDLDLPRFLSATEVVRLASKDPEGRMTLAVIEGLLKSYRPLNLDCVDLLPTATPRAAELFAQFVEDHSYQSISIQASALGYPEHVSQSEKEF